MYNSLFNLCIARKEAYTLQRYDKLTGSLMYLMNVNFPHRGTNASD